ncbi:methionyl-tRNA synthetase [Microbotryomycetes sp. JL201]|nr:methionyl-tRNA synthetase [Microbotryomycetes sp. JL201]
MKYLGSLPEYKSQRAQFLYSSLPSRKVANPTGYNGAITWWRNTLHTLASKGLLGDDKLVLHVDEDLRERLRWDKIGRPSSLGAVICELALKGELVSIDDYIRASGQSDPTSVLSLVTKPLSWAFAKLLGSSPTSEEIDQKEWQQSQGEWVIEPLVEKAAAAATQQLKELGYDAVSRLFTLRSLQAAIGNACLPGVKLSEQDCRVLAEYLSSKGVCITDGEVIKLAPLKSVGASSSELRITDSDRGIMTLKTSLESLEAHIAAIETRIQKEQNQAVTYHAKKQINMAKHHIVARKRLEALLTQRVASKDKVSEVLTGIEKAVGDEQTMQALELGTKTLRSLISSPHLSLEHIEETTGALSDALADANEINEAVTQVGQLDSTLEEEVEAELRELIESAEVAEKKELEKEGAEDKTQQLPVAGSSTALPQTKELMGETSPELKRISDAKQVLRSTLAPQGAMETVQRGEKEEDYYVTTPIFYVNAEPHIGHLHSMLLADVYKRFWSLRDGGSSSSSPPILCTGTDEHGLKIQRVAESRGLTAKQLCDAVSPRFKDLANAANMDYDVFIRTTEDRHRAAVEHVWRELDNRGYIYKDSYAGWYAVSDEAYYTPAQISEVTDPVSGEKYKISTESGSRVEWMEEENYKFKLSAFRDQLIQWLSAEPNRNAKQVRVPFSALQPSSRTQALLSSLTAPGDGDLADLSISRPSSRLQWGIPVPYDPEHTIYVWIDALVNYLTAAGYPWRGGEAFTRGKLWPPRLQVVGKDIIRFHALYLPAILMALDLPLPRNLLAHGHWTMDKLKMSKSRGNVANPFEAMSVWGVDTIRIYLMKAGGNSGVDADYSAQEIEGFYKKSLMGQLGNLLSRTSNEKLVAKLSDPGLLVRMPNKVESEDEKIVEMLKDLPKSFDNHMASFDVHKALSTIFDTISESNKHIQVLAPWSSAASSDSVHRALFYSRETLRITGLCLQPFMPTKAVELLDRLGVDANERTWSSAAFGKGGTVVSRDRQKKAVLFPPVKVPGAE